MNRHEKLSIGELTVTTINSGGSVPTTPLASGKIWVGNASGVAAPLTVSGDITISNAGVAAIATGVVVNADVKSDAAIAFSKLAALTDGNILVGSAANVATSVAMSGDVTILNTGATAIGANKVTAAMLATAITPSHVVKYAGKSVVEDDADSSIVITVTGAAAATDFAQAQLIAATADVYVEKTVVTDNTVTVTLSGAGGAGTQVSYVVYRAIA